MRENFEISYDPAEKLVRITTRGFWTVETCHAFAADLAQIVAVSGRNCDVLANTLRCKVHSAEVRETLTELAKNGEASMTGRTAFVVPSALLRIQARAIVSEGNAVNAFFETEEEALAWLAIK